MSALSDKAVKIAITQVGQQEKPLGSNWGKPVQDYLKSVGLIHPASWCMAFVYWCFDQAAGPGKPPLVKTGGVLDAWNKANKANKVTTGPKPGDIMIMDHGKGLGHTGIVEKVDQNFLYTIEGNTNDTGSREGIEVDRKRRPIVNKLIKGYLRY